jgi:hypothetical protein
MMPNTLHVQCLNCGEFALTGNHADPDSALGPGCRCCTIVHDHGPDCPEDCAQVHDHAAAANACTGKHEGRPCPHDPENCPVLGGGHTAPTGDPADPSGHMVRGTCPGGHCGKGVDGCTVCRPLTITALPGAVGTLQPFTGTGG